MSILGMILRGRVAPERVLVIGASTDSAQLSAAIRANPADYILLEPAIDPFDGRTSLRSLFDQVRPDRIIVGSPDAARYIEMADMVHARVNGIVVETTAEAQQRLAGKLAIETLTPLSLACDAASGQRHFKRALSLFGAALGLLLMAPLMLLIAILIKLDSSGSVLFMQERIGLGGRRFRLFKFRSMHPLEGASSEWERDHIDRITRVGGWLRRYHLDELPQFFNILRGDMDLVGPRPHPVTNHELFEREIPYYSLRCQTRPGLTGWAQVRYGYANDLHGEVEKMRYDLYYLTHQSLALDVWIALQTVRLLLLGRREAEVAAVRQSPTRPAA